jgi:uncharacterized membrane protein HdeD (DUF308 family)
MTAETFADNIKKRAGWSILMGVLLAILGVFLIAYPLAAATMTTLIIGWTLLFAAGAQIVFSFSSHSAGRFFLKLLLGIVYGIAGFALLSSPLRGVATLTAFLGSLLLVYGVVDVALAFQMRPIEGWGWFLADAIASVLMGLLILARWPSSSIWAIGTLVGLAVLMAGISRIMVGSGIRRGVSRVEDTIRRAA